MSCSLDFSTPHSYIFFFNDTATTEIYTLSLHDALPILPVRDPLAGPGHGAGVRPQGHILPRSGQLVGGGMGKFRTIRFQDRKSTRLNSSHQIISYAVFCLKKKTTLFTPIPRNLLLAHMA